MIRVIILIKIFFGILLLWLINTGSAQVSDKIIDIEISPAVENNEVVINANLVASQRLSGIELAYRIFGQSEFKRIEMNIIGNNAIAKIPREQVISPFIDYYLILKLVDSGENETYPLENPVENPLKILIEPREENYEITWISPDTGTKYEDLLIAFSLFGVDNSVDLSSTKIFLNKDDITGFAIRSEDLYTVKPENFQQGLKTGKHQIRVEIFNKNGSRIKIEKKDFVVVPAFTVGETGISSIKYKGNLQLETRGENISGITNNYHRGNFNASSEFGIIKAFGRVYATNEEKNDRQPQNRFLVGVETPWLKIGYGDNYPSFPSLIMNGKRIRGLSANLDLSAFSLDIAYGEVNRKIESRITEVISDSVGLDSNSTYFRIDNNRWALLNNRGTFKRNLLVVRPGLNSGKNFSLGFNFLKSKDDIHSIKYGIAPQENLVVGSDLLLAFADRRIEINGQVAFSATNNDISKGTINSEDIDSLFSSLSDAERNVIHSIKDIGSKLITINENLVPLSLKNFTTLAYEGSLILNYFNNMLSFAYIRRGGSYESFGQTYLRTDVDGFTITDRIRLVKNRLMLYAGYEQLSDNTTKTKAATTQYKTYNATISYHPGFDFPSISTGFNYSNAGNKLLGDLPSAVKENILRYYIQSGYNFYLFTKHQAIVSFSNSNRNDLTSRNLDTKNLSVSLGLNTYYNIPLQTSINFSNFISRFAKSLADSSIATDIKYSTITLTVLYRLFNNKLQINGALRPAFGDIQRGAYEVGTQYEIFKDIFASTQVTYYSNKFSKAEYIWNFMIRYGF